MRLKPTNLHHHHHPPPPPEQLLLLHSTATCMGGALRGLVGWGGGWGTTCCFLSRGCNPEQLNGEHVQQHRHESASLSPHSLFFPFQFTEHLGGGALPSPPPLLQDPSFRTAPALITPLTVHEGRLLVTVFRDQHNHDEKKKQLTLPTPTLTPPG